MARDQRKKTKNKSDTLATRSHSFRSVPQFPEGMLGAPKTTLHRASSNSHHLRDLGHRMILDVSELEQSRRRLVPHFAENRADPVARFLALEVGFPIRCRVKRFRKRLASPSRFAAQLIEHPVPGDADQPSE